jgi:hypothetical protein
MAVYDKEKEPFKKHQPPSSVGEDNDKNETAQDLSEKEAQSSTDSSAENDPSIKEESDAVKGPGSTQSHDFYKPSTARFKGKITSNISKKALAGGLGAGLATLIIVVASLSGFLNVFKLDHIMKNIEGKAFQRYQVSMDHRSQKWIEAYLMIRLGEVEDPDLAPKDRDNIVFRAEKVKTDDPIYDWYRTLRTSKFEKDLTDKYGIKFASVIKRGSHGYIVRPAIVTLKDKKIKMSLSEAHLNALTDLDINKLNGELRQFIEVKEYGSDKEARKAIKNVVNQETHSWQVIKRRHIRKNIQNMIGVRDWKFFEKTRTKVDEMKKGVRNKIIKAAMPESTKTGKFIQCLFGLTECKSSSDPIDKTNRTPTPELTGKNLEGGQTSEPDVPDSNNPDAKTPNGGNDVADLYKGNMDKALAGKSEDLMLFGVKATIIKEIVAEILAKTNIATTIVSIVDAFARIDKGLQDGTLVKMVTIARATQAIALYTTYATASDQLRTGEVTGPEVDSFMETINSVSNSEGWTNVIGSSKDTTQAESATNDFEAAKNRQEYCSSEHQTAIQLPKNHSVAEREFQYLCGSQKIGGTSLAASLTKWWKDTFGFMEPLLNAYRNTIGKVLSFFNKILGTLTGWITEKFLKLTGLDKQIEKIMSWALTEVASFLGAGPIMNGTEPSGVFLNNMTQGGAYTAEASARYQGAAVTTEKTAKLAHQNTVAYLNDASSQQSLVSKYLSFDNPDSAVSQTVFATIQDTGVHNMSGLANGLMRIVAKAPLFIFSHPVKAATDDPYAAANFAGIQTYDVAPKCYNLDPIRMKPQDVTNANEILPSDKRFTADELTWDLVNNNTSFYDAVYAKLGDVNNADEIAQKIFDCAALDTSLRGGLGALYGYTEDNGLESNESEGTGSTTIGDCTGLNLGNKATEKKGNEDGTMGDHDQYKLPMPGPGYVSDLGGTTNQNDEWGSKELVETIYQVGKKWEAKHPDINFTVGDLDNASTVHVSHRAGIDVDISGCPLMISCGGAYKQELAIELAKMFYEAGNIDVIGYTDPGVISAVSNLGKMEPWAGHDTHFHVRIVKGKTPKGCE